MARPGRKRMLGKREPSGRLSRVGREQERRPPETQARWNEARAGLNAVVTLAERGIISLQARRAIESFAEWCSYPSGLREFGPWDSLAKNYNEAEIIKNVVVLNRLPDWLKDPSTVSPSAPETKAFIRAAEAFGRVWR